MPAPARPYDKFMVAYRIGADAQLGEIRPEQRWVWIGGVLALAAQSPIRGHLLTAKVEPVTVAHVKKAAAVGTRLAAGSLDAFRDLDLIQVDEELGVEWVPNFTIYNPNPPKESVEGKRLRKRASRARQKLLERVEIAA
jgi:hypothetical protein